MQPTDKNHKSRKSLEKQPEAEAGIEFFASHAPCGGFFVAEVVRGSAQRASTRAPYLEYVVRSMGRSKHPHQLTSLVQMGRNPKHKRRSSIQRVIFETLAHILPLLQSYASKVVSGPSQGITLKCTFLFVMEQSSTNMEQSTGPLQRTFQKTVDGNLLLHRALL